MKHPSVADTVGGTVRQRAVRVLRDRILTGDLRPGDRLDLDAICQEFGTSRTPVREALLELSFQGLVHVAARSGVTVIGVSPDRTMDNFGILAALSGKAAEWAASRVTPDVLDQLNGLGVVLGAVDEGEELIRANWEFHRLINKAAGSQHLVSLIRQSVRLIPSNFLAVIPVHNQDEHEELLSDIRKGRSLHARRVAERHVLGAGEALARWLVEQPAPQGDGAARTGPTALSFNAENSGDGSVRDAH
jgi:DNA-binding GntR family transcriptional regulator